MVVKCELVVAGQLFLVFIDVFLYVELFQVKALHKNVIEALVITECAREDIVIIPRITLIQTDYPFEFKITQFPLKVFFAMTIYMSKGQSLIMAGIGLREECFSHGFSMSHVLELALPIISSFYFIVFYETIQTSFLNHHISLHKEHSKKVYKLGNKVALKTLKRSSVELTRPLLLELKRCFANEMGLFLVLSITGYVYPKNKPLIKKILMLYFLTKVRSIRDIDVMIINDYEFCGSVGDNTNG
ncbi:ATP-dependent DNA helicase PIF1-like [Aphis craccivora]|uniref:ATP-dependent DNA helicase PIF1-like n=1 Tax=Aphis craccivora TaxID=307492 RepID=A0A6G0ZPB6_APHCR|nr:ATP-dependent DNA helicase PIF1-like [Aphis craccivora]